MTNVRIPAVPRVAAYLSLPASNGKVFRDRGLLLWRSRIWERMSGITLKKLLIRIATVAGLPLSSTTLDKNQQFLSYENMRDDYSSVFVIPNDITMYALPELVRMNHIVYMPSYEILHILQSSVPYGFMVHPPSSQLLESIERNSTLQETMPRPFWAPQGCHLSHFKYWMSVSDFDTGTIRVDSMFDLVAMALAQHNEYVHNGKVTIFGENGHYDDNKLQTARSFWRNTIKTAFVDVDRKTEL